MCLMHLIVFFFGWGGGGSWVFTGFWFDLRGVVAGVSPDVPGLEYGHRGTPLLPGPSDGAGATSVFLDAVGSSRRVRPRPGSPTLLRFSASDGPRFWSNNYINWPTSVPRIFLCFFLVAMRMGIFFQLPFVDTEMMCHWNDAIQQIFVSMSLIRSSVVYWDIFRFSSLKLDVSFIVFPWLRFGWRTFPVISVVSFFRTRFERVAEKIVFFSSVGRRWKISPARLSFRSDQPLGTESPANEAALLDDRHISSRKIKKTERNFPSTRRYRAPSQRIEENRRRLGKLALNSLKKKPTSSTRIVFGYVPKCRVKPQKKIDSNAASNLKSNLS